LLNQSCWCASGRRQRRRFSVHHSVLLASAARCCRRSLLPGLSPRCIRRLFFDNRTRNHGNASTNGSLWIFGQRGGQPPKSRLTAGTPRCHKAFGDDAAPGLFSVARDAVDMGIARVLEVERFHRVPSLSSRGWRSAPRDPSHTLSITHTAKSVINRPARGPSPPSQARDDTRLRWPRFVNARRICGRPILRSFDRHGISRFVLPYERFTKLIECSLFYFAARLIH
jgi:hypothetical protein